MSVSVTLRSVKGDPLTIPEVDTNFSNIKAAIDGQDSAIAAATNTANNASSAVSSLSGTVSGLSSTVSNHESRITAIEGGGGGGTGGGFFSATKSASQTVSTSGTPTTVKVSYNVENADADGAYDAVASRYTAPASGWYWFKASTRLDATAKSTPVGIGTSIWFKVNGSSNPIIAERYGSDDSETGGHTVEVSGAVYLALGHYVEVYFECDTTSGSITWQLTNDGSKTFFQGFQIA